jgi:hypothetical protein
MNTFIGCLIALAAWIGTHASADVVQESSSTVEKISLCAVQADPALYDHKLIEVRGIVSHGFEDFTLSEPHCGQRAGIWLEYGGTVNSKTVYCCGVRAGASRNGVLVVEGISIPLMKDALFRRFDGRVRTGGEARFPARLVGRFFAGAKQRTTSGSWGGYGHLGCCSLLVIQQVLPLDGRMDADGR